MFTLIFIALSKSNLTQKWKRVDDFEVIITMLKNYYGNDNDFNNNNEDNKHVNLTGSINSSTDDVHNINSNTNNSIGFTIIFQG